MHRSLVLVATFFVLALFECYASPSSEAAYEATPAAGMCDAPGPPRGALASPSAPTEQEGSSPVVEPQRLSSDLVEPGIAVDAATAERIVAGIENVVACRNAGDYAAYAALLTPNRIQAEVGTTNPSDVVSDLEAFNLPITILSLGDVHTHADGRLSAEFVHLFGPHLYYRSRIYVVEEGGYVKFDEEVYLPEAPPGLLATVDVRLVDFAFALSQDRMTNAQYVALHGKNEGRYAHEILVVRLPAGATAEQALTGEIPEEQIAFVGQAPLAPGQTDDLVLVNLEPGFYTLLCLTDEPDGVPHAARGMVAQLTIEGIAPPTGKNR